MMTRTSHRETGSFHRVQKHECGYFCPFLIESEGGYVCTKTGECFGHLFDNSVEVHGVLTKVESSDAAVVKTNKVVEREPETTDIIHRMKVCRTSSSRSTERHDRQILFDTAEEWCSVECSGK